jgi:hypothetical protein
MTKVGCAAVGSKSMKPTAPAVKAGKSTTAMPATTPAPAVKPTASTAPAVKATATATASTATTPRDCRSVRDDAKCANRDARRQNSYCFLFHGRSQSKF